LFYKITEEKTTFIVLFVDDTLIFSKRQLDIDQFVVSMNRHYELTLDTKADSFLGINIGHGAVTLTQSKLLQKLFKEHPEQPSGRKARTSTHPYGPVPSHNKEKEQSPHPNDDVLTAARALDVSNQESTRHHGSCFFRSNQVNQPHRGRLPTNILHS
jgi:hypothetical protein